MNRNLSASPEFYARNTRRRILKLILALCAAAAFLPAAPLQAQISPASDQLLHRMYASPDFEVKYFGPARWMDDGSFYTTVEPSAAVKDARDIVRVETATGKREVLVSASQLIPTNEKSPLDFENFFLSSDKSKLLLYTNTEQVWRRNTRGDYWVLDLRAKTLRKLGGPDAPSSSLMFAKFSPDGAQVAYVRANNIYAENLATGKISQLTTDGSATIINGTSDWVYEEELDVRDAFRWSPDSRRIAYWQFDTSNVGIFKLIYNLGAPKEIVTGFPYPGLGVYPSVLNIPYPIPGTTNSSVRVGVVSAAGGETRWMAVPGDPRDNYIARMEWAPAPGTGANPAANDLVIEHLNRLQNANDVLLADASTGAVQQIFRDQDPAWVDVNDEIKWIHNGEAFLWLSERDGWRHVYRVSRDGKSVHVLTPGAYDVTSIAGVDEKNGSFYFIASPENATQRYLYRAPLNPAPIVAPERVSPAAAPGTHVYDISPDARWAFHIYSRADVTPVTDLVELPSHKSARVLEDNHELRANAAALLTTPTEFFKVDIGEGVTLDAWMLKPPHFDPAKKYPVLVYVYGEPAAQTVEDEWADWNFDFHRIVADAGYIVVSFDNRGTPAPKGRAWRKIIYGAIHPVIVKDQSAALKVFLQSHPYADSARVALWGWSGGGSSTLNLMFRSPDLYKVGMAVAPVPDLRLYDTIYQERYMGLPLQNVEGYRSSSAINFAAGLKGHLLLVHGSGDDNVHYSGSELLLNRLIELDKPIDFMEYPNRTHAINEGPNTTLHLYSLLLRYLEEHIPPTPLAQQP
ncbi:MAG: S9 family peptidase [Candidatus Acidiferrales bacterium]